MSDGCTDCGRKGGCDHRKQGMFAAIDEALARLYPSRRWVERGEAAGPALEGLLPGEGDPREAPASLRGAALAERVAARMGTLALLVPGAADEYCDYVYLLCLGRTPSLLELREGQADVAQVLAEAPDGEPMEISELYLRVALSSLAPFAAVQQVSLRGSLLPGAERAAGGEDDPAPAGTTPPLVLIEESPRTGVFDPVLLPRLKTLVAVLAELDLRNLDFGDLTGAPADFDAGDYAARYGGAPALANYLFYPQPASSIRTTAVVLSHRAGIE